MELENYHWTLKCNSWCAAAAAEDWAIFGLHKPANVANIDVALHTPSIIILFHYEQCDLDQFLYKSYSVASPPGLMLVVKCLICSSERCIRVEADTDQSCEYIIVIVDGGSAADTKQQDPLSGDLGLLTDDSAHDNCLWGEILLLSQDAPLSQLVARFDGWWCWLCVVRSSECGSAGCWLRLRCDRVQPVLHWYSSTQHGVDRDHSQIIWFISALQPVSHKVKLSVEWVWHILGIIVVQIEKWH